jgi:glutathione S-transferase
MIELYVFPPSPRAFKVLAVANHLEVPYEIRLVDFRTGAQKAPEYAALNPNRRMPTLKHGDYVLWESCAIQHYLAAQRPDAGLLPSEERGRLDVLRWQFWDLAHWDRACAVFVVEYVAKPLVLGVNAPDQDAIARGTDAFHREAPVLNQQLNGRQFRHRRGADAGRFCARRGAEFRRGRAHPAGAVPGDPAVACQPARAALLAEDAGAERDSGGADRVSGAGSTRWQQPRQRLRGA